MIHDRKDDTDLYKEMTVHTGKLKEYIQSSCSFTIHDLQTLAKVLENKPRMHVKETLAFMIHDRKDIKYLDEVLRKHTGMWRYISVSFPEHPTLHGKDVLVAGCHPREIKDIVREYPNFNENIDSIFVPHDSSSDEHDE